ncbi:MAG: alanine racemase [Streptococcaceae bacterium]|jgi:alanine racemase|nr:alanine racemase [Streptococcaceae bacterium]
MIESWHRETLVKVDLDAIRENIRALKAIVSDKPIWAVVKANAYGHGARAVARAVSDLVAGFCVSNLDEALEIREMVEELPILVLSGIPVEDAMLARDKEISLTAPSLEWLSNLTAQNADLTGLSLHLKVDSGMGRIGVRQADEANQMIAMMDAAAVKFDGVFTHFATADEADTSHYESQVARFSELLSNLTRRPTYVHSTNSAAALWHQAEICDFVRLGIGMYGLNPSGVALESPIKLQPALSLSTKLSHVKELPAGESVGYGAEFTATEPTWVGTLPIGYADGWSRSLTGFHVLVDGQLCEIIGRVSMDQTTICLPHAYPIGTPVVLIGQSGDLAVSAQDVADYRGTIHYEVLCGLSDRIPRTYE